jgi:hypothetical protein
MSKNYAYQANEEFQPMFTTQKLRKPNNLNGVNFSERVIIESTIDELANAAKDPYAASLPLIASAGLGDAKRYASARTTMLTMLTALNEKPNDYAEWMRSNSFKAWMWGRVLLAADTMADSKTILQSKNKLSFLLNKEITKDDNFAFYTWAQAYDATLNIKEYQTFKKAMMQNAVLLSKKSKEDPANHGALSDALWAWVMNLSAAANAGDQKNYTLIKEQIKVLTGAESVTKSLETGLLRTAESNDYPAWALGKVRSAAAIMRDNMLYQEVDLALISSIYGANQAGAKAEYSLAVIENQLALQRENELQVTHLRAKM